MAPRRFFVLLLSAIALVVSSIALLPGASAQTLLYTVDTTEDLSFDSGTPVGSYCRPTGDPDCSLRRAIGEAGRDTIASNIEFGVTGTFTINTALGGLLIASNNLTIDARPSPPLTDIRVRIEGGGATFPGLTITGGNVRIFGLSITGFTTDLATRGAGIELQGPGATGNIISGNRLGVLPDGVTPGANNYGIAITNGATNNTVTENIIAGNTSFGVLILNASNNKIERSGIGIGIGDVDVGNGQAGVIITSSGGTSSGNSIGGVDPGLANTISGNGPPGFTDRAGVLLSGSGTTGNFIRANRIGLNAGGTAAVANSGDGIRIEAGASGNTIGGISTPLVISGNSRYGIRITGNATSGNTVGLGTNVGLNGARNGALGNVGGGISIDEGARNTTVDGSAVAGNTGVPGITITSTGATGTTIANSFVGRIPNPSGTGPALALPNGVGIQIINAGSTSVLTTTVGNNTGAGVLVQSTAPVTVSASTVVENGEAGVFLDGPSGSQLRTSVISGNLQLGVRLRGVTDTAILSNTILGSPGGGLLLETTGVSVTNRTTLTGNIVSGNGLFGIRLSGAVTSTLRRNYVGLNQALNDRLPNSGNGVEIFDAQNTFSMDLYSAGNVGAGVVISGTNSVSTTLNGTVAGLSNGGTGFIVSEPNDGPGVRVTGGAQQTTIRGGTLGGAAPDASGPPGVAIEATSGVTVTGARIGWVTTTISPSSPPIAHPFGVGIAVTGPLTDVQLLTNTLRFNRGAAILTTGEARRVRMIDNRLSGNGDAIRLAGTTLLTARPPTSDPGSLTNPNHDIDPPPIDVTSFSDPLRLRVGDQGVIDGFVITSTNKTETGLSPVSACVTCTIQVFRPGPEGTPTAGQGYETVPTIPVGGDLTQATNSFAVPDSGRFTRQLVGGVGPAGSQLLLIATDGFGNSSEYAVFPVSSGFTLENLGPDQSAAPGDTVTYTLRLSNTGTLDVTGLRLQTSGTFPDWGLVTNPVTNTVFTSGAPLEAGSSRLITVSLRLPPGPRPSVNAGATDVTTVAVIKDGGSVSQSVRLTTTVLPRPVLVITPTVSVGKARPTETVPHNHIIRNNGNVTVTVNLTSRTIDPVGQTGLWVTTINTPTFTLAPGTETRVRVDVLVPEGAQVNDPGGNPVQATTIVSATVPVSPTGGFGPITVTFTDTTRVDFEPDAALTDSGQRKQGAAGQTVVFTHFVRNLSNAPARFCFVWTSSLGSTLTFVSRTDGFTIDNNGCFSLGTGDRDSLAQFDARVLVNRRALPGQEDSIDISLRNVDTNETIGSARVVDTVEVVRGEVLPRIWLPYVSR